MIIKNTTVIVDNDTVLKNKSIVIVDDEIKTVDDFENVIEGYKDEEIIDGSNRWFMPGLVDCHTHSGQQLLKGKVLDAKPIIWTRIMLPFESTLDKETMMLNAELCALEMIKSGTVGFIDAGSYHMDTAAEVFQQSGLIGAITASTMDDKNLPKSIYTNTDQAVEVLDQLYEEYNSDSLKVYYSLRALNNCSTELIEKVFNRAKDRNTFVVAHMNEYQKEIETIIGRTGKRPYEFLNDLKLLDGKFIGAHSLLLSDSEKEIIRMNENIHLNHSPFSNSGKAIPNTPQLLDYGINIGLGTDGAAHGGLSLWNEMKIFRCTMNIHHGVPNNIYDIMSSRSILKMATENGFKMLEEKAGKIKPGYKANLIGIKSNTALLIPTGDIINTILECVGANDVYDSIVRGKFLMKDREVLTLDEEKIISKAMEYDNK